ncbi:MAG: hypothetical protein RIQ89_25 [Bacteroidota bacterium]
MKTRYSLISFCSFLFISLNAMGAGKIASRVQQLTQEGRSFYAQRLFSVSTHTHELEKVKASVKHATILSLDHDALRNINYTQPEQLELSWPHRGNTVVVKLYKKDITPVDFKLLTSGSGVVNYKQGLHYRGIVNGDQNSLVAISIFNNDVMGLVMTDEGNFNLGAIEDDSYKRYIFYNDKDLAAPLNFECGTEHANVNRSNMRQAAPGNTNAGTLFCVRLYWEVDYPIFVDKGSLAAATNYMTALYNQTDILYDNDNISTLLGTMFVWTTPSGYAGTSSFDYLSQFGASVTTLPEDLGHLINYENYGGVAYLDVLCDPTQSIKIAYSGIDATFNNVPTYSWSVMVITHEQGHNMGSPHTHACEWNGNFTAIDSCGPAAGYPFEGSCTNAPLPTNGGTIMSYCHLVGGVGINLNNGFGPQPAALIVGEINSALCLTNCATSCPFCTGTTTLTSCSGILNDGSGGNDYCDNSDCQWIIAPVGATNVTLNFSSFSTQATNDIVRIYDGNSIAAPLIGTYSGTTLPPTITSSGGSITVRFTTNATVVNSGWQLNYSCSIPNTCSGQTILTTCPGTFGDGSNALDYQDNLNCAWLLQAPVGNTITLDFNVFNTELSYDFVRIYDGSSTAATFLGEYSGTLFPPIITSSSNTLYVTFTSDVSVTAPGFEAFYTCNSPVTACGGLTTINNCSGTITDGSGANNYSNNSNCAWLINPTTPASSITLNFTTLNTQAGNDIITVYNGPDDASPIIGTYSGTTVPSAITAFSGVMYITFVTNGSVTAAGWSATYTCNSVLYCNGQTNLTTCPGSFNDGSGTAPYLNNGTCSWLIQPAGVSSITLSFSSFVTEAGYDSVVVFDGSTTAAPRLGNFSGITLPPSVTSSGGSMLVVFYTDVSIQEAGWVANYTCTTPPSCSGTTTLTTCNGTFADGSGNNNYSNNLDCSWLINPGSTTGSIYLNFTSFATQSINDIVRVYDGNSAAAPLIGTFSGTTLPTQIISSGSTLFVRFTTNGSTTAAGWAANYTCSPVCGNPTVFTTCPGAVSDGSTANNYLNNFACTYLIDPPGATSVTLTFAEFSTQANNDLVYVYDGANSSGILLGTFSGATLPPTLTANSGKMFIRFITNSATTFPGWLASYTCLPCNAAPVIQGNTPICDDALTLLSTGVFDSYLWSNGATTSSIQVGPGSYSVNVVDSFGCTGQDNFIVSAYPGITPSVTQDGSWLIATPSNPNYTYLWLYNGNSSGCNGDSCQIIGNGNYEVIVTDNNGCADTSVTFNVITAGVQELNNAVAVLYPNPANDLINIQFYNQLSNMATTIEWYNSLGQVVLSQLLPSSNKSSATVDVAALSPGQYTVRLISGDKVYTQSITIKR